MHWSQNDHIIDYKLTFMFTTIQFFFVFLKEVSYVLQVCIYLIENTVKTKNVK